MTWENSADVREKHISGNHFWSLHLALLFGHFWQLSILLELLFGITEKYQNKNFLPLRNDQLQYTFTRVQFLLENRIFLL